jgi:hypothetical protein
MEPRLKLEQAIQLAVTNGVLIDKRDEMPRGTRWGGEWPKRKFEDILGVCVHQNAGGTDPMDTARYHAGPNHISDEGLPGICYNLAILPDGEVWLVEDLLSRTYAQNADDDKGYPGDENTHLASVLVMGDFDGPGYIGTMNPTGAQIGSLIWVFQWLRGIFGFGKEGICGHYHFGKAACPGIKTAQVIEEERVGYKCFETIMDWQRALVDLEYDLGNSGRDGDGVDGDWGRKSKRALRAFQKLNGLRLTGFRDPFTELMLIRQLKPPPDPPLEGKKEGLNGIATELANIAVKLAKIADENS